MNPASIVHSVVVVVVSWGDQPLFARTVGRGQSLWLGDRPSDLPLPFTERFPLVQFDRPWPVVTVPSDGLPAQRMPLAPSDTVTLKAGDFSLAVARVEIDRSERRRLRMVVEPARWAAAVAFLLLSTLALMARSLPSLGLTELGQIERALSIELHPPLGSREEPEAMAPPLHLSRRPAPYLVPIYGLVRCGDDVMGRSDAIAETGRYAIEGPKDNVDPHLAAKRGGAPPALALTAKALRATGGDRKAPTGPWARETALGIDAESARGKLWGDPIEDASGNEGFGLPRIEGGIAKRLDWTSAESSHSSPRIVHTGLRVQGRLRPSVVTGAVASRFDRFYACYDRAREGAPDLGGRLELELEIGTDGRVAAARAKNSTIADPELTSCLVASVSDLTLPADQIGSTVLVYPLFLEPGTGRNAQALLRRLERPKKLPASCCSK